MADKGRKAYGKGRAPRRPPGEAKPRERYNHVIFRDWCKSCGICSAFCPRHVIGRDETGAPVIERPEECIGCRFCELHCPDFAITVQEKQADSEDAP
jgi:2-oxoglutarate ferredoxin oxidoreductase subunit delta